MRFFLLGSSAAEGYPGLFCECEHCRQARAAGGKNLRLRTSALVNEDLLIDPGPDMLAASQRHSLSFANLRHVLITHFHEDHWLLDNLLYHHHWFRGVEVPTLHLYGGPRLEQEVETLCTRYSQSAEDFSIEPHVIQPLESFTAGTCRVQSFPATHSPQTDPMIYGITEASRRLLYVTDTGPLPEITWEALAGFQARLVVMELTMGPESNEHHMGREDFLTTVERMKKDGVIAAEGKIVAHHFSHHHTPLHDQLESELAAYGIIAGYDGLALEV